MTDEQTRYKNYLEQGLKRLGAEDVSVEQESNEYVIHTSIEGFNFVIDTDLLTTFEIKINNYFREVTDYLNGDFKDVIDWYIDIIKQIIKGEYTLIRYSRGGKEICRYIQLKDGKLLSDYQNHFKLFAQKESIPAGKL